MNEQREMVIKTLVTYGCSTANDIVRLVKQEYNVLLTPAKIAGAMRPLIARGLAANADNGNGKKVYWITEYGKEVFM